MRINIPCPTPEQAAYLDRLGDPGGLPKDTVIGGPQLSPTVSQHLGWLKMYADGMTAENWRDMRDRIARQLVELSAELKK